MDTINPKYKEWDDALDELSRDRQMRQMEIQRLRDEHPKGAPKAVFNTFRTLENELKMIDETEGRLRAKAPIGYDRYSQTKHKLPGDEGPGMWDKFKAGVKDTGKVLSDPGAAATSIASGIGNIVTLPSRMVHGAVKGLTGGKVDIPGFGNVVQSGLGELEKRAHQKAGSDPEGTGAEVVRSVSGMAVPVGPALKGGELLKNMIKGGGTAAGFYGAENISKGENPLDAGTLISAGAGAGVGGVLGKLMTKKKPSVGEGAKASDTGESAGQQAAEAVKPTGPRMLEDTRVQPGEMKGGVVYGKEPPRGLPAPEPREPSQYETMVGKIRSRPSDVLSEEERRFLMHEFKQPKPVPPPNAVGSRETIESPLDMIRSRAAQDVSTPPASPPYPGSMYGMPGVKAPELTTPEVKVTGKRMDVLKKGKSGKEKKVSETSGSIMSVDEFMPTGLGKSKEVVSEEGKIGKVSAAVDKELEKKEFMKEGEKYLSNVIGGKVEPKDAASRVKAVREAKAAAKKVQPPSVKGSEPPLVEVPPIMAHEQKPLPKPGQASAKNLTEVPVAETTLDDFIKSKGFKVEQKADPLHGTFYRVFDKKGKLFASGDREAILNTTQSRPEADGVKLRSFPPEPKEVAEMFEKAFKEAGAKIKPAADIAHDFMRNWKTLRVTGRDSPEMAEAADVVKKHFNATGERFRDYLYKPGEDGTLRPTKYFAFDNLDPSKRQKVVRAAVYGDKLGRVFDDATLSKYLEPDEVTAYRGVREALDEAWRQRKELAIEMARGKDSLSSIDMKLMDAAKREGYLPHIWPGKYEVYMNGEKQTFMGKGDVEPRSYFETEFQAIKHVHDLKMKNPTAKVNIVHHADKDFLEIGPVEQGILSSQIKKNLATMRDIERIGSFDEKLIDEASKFARSLESFTRHLMRRKGEEGYATADMDKIIQAYLYKNSKFIETKRMQVALGNIIQQSKNLPLDQQQWIRHIGEKVAGKPTWDDAWINETFSKPPYNKLITPEGVHATVRKTHEAARHIFLGVGNVGYAAANAYSLVQQVWPGLAREASKSGLGPLAAEEYMMKGVQAFFNDKKLRQELAHKGIIDIQKMSEAIPDIKRSKGGNAVLNASMWLGTTTEEFTRGVAAIGRYKMAIDQGWPKEEALKAARDFVGDTLGDYSKAGRPQAFTGTVGSTAGMFKTFTVVYLANMFRAGSGLTKGEVGAFTRYAMAMIGLGGVMGLPFMDDLDDMMLDNFGKSPKEWLEQNTPEWFREGVLTSLASSAGLPHINMSHRVGIPDVVPSNIKSALGPIVGNAYQLAKDVYENPNVHDIVESAEKAFLPTSIKNVIKSQSDVFNQRDLPGVELSQGERATKALGLPPAKEVQERELYYRRAAKAGYRNKRLQKLADKILDDRASSADLDEYVDLGPSRQHLKNAELNRTLSPLDRQDRQLPKLLRER